MTNQIQNPKDGKATLMIDTASEKAGVWLTLDGKVAGERKWNNGPGAGLRLLKEIDGLLEDNGLKIADIGAVGVNVTAKKWFSSVRAGVAVANSLAAAGDVKLYEMDGFNGDYVSDEMELVKMAKVRYLPKIT